MIWNISLDILSSTATSKVVALWNTTSKDEKLPSVNTSTHINKSSQQNLDNLLLQYNIVDTISTVLPTIHY